LNVGWETVPLGVPVTVIFPAADVPVNVGWETVPLGVPFAVIVAAVPVKVLLNPVGTGIFPVTNLTAEPLKVGAVA